MKDNFYGFAYTGGSRYTGNWIFNYLKPRSINNMVYPPLNITKEYQQFLAYGTWYFRQFNPQDPIVYAPYMPLTNTKVNNKKSE